VYTVLLPTDMLGHIHHDITKLFAEEIAMLIMISSMTMAT